MQILQHGVLGEKGFTYASNVNGKMQWSYSEDTIHDMRHIGDICNLALLHHLERVWVHPGIDTFNALPDNFIEDASETHVTGKSDFEKYAYFEVYRKQVAYAKEVGIHFTLHPFSKWQIEEAHTDKQIYLAVSYLETLLNIPLRYSAGFIGQELIRQTNTGRKAGNLQPCESDLSLFIKTTGASRPFHRPLTPEEEAMPWLLMIDKNANFLSCSSIQLGIGNYEHILNPTFTKYDVGLWHVTIEGTSLYEGVDMPSACTLLLEKQKTGWLYTATVQLLQELGYQLTFHEALLWPMPYRTTVLDAWNKLLSHAYTELRMNTTRYTSEVARNLAKSMLREMYVKGLSWLTMDIEEGRGNYLDMPHWYHLVIAEAYQRMIRNVITFEKLGMKPVAMPTNDSLIYASHEKDIALALPGIRLEQKPGHYKQVWCLPLEECKHLFTRENATGMINIELKKIARKYGYYA